MQKLLKKISGFPGRESLLDLYLSRRKFLSTGCAAGLCFTACTNSGTENKMNNTPETADISFGLTADLHYADKGKWNTRFYRESDEKLRECIETFNSLKPDFIVELGDFVDKAEKEIEFEYLRTINGIFNEFEGERHYVLGNHDTGTFSKTEFLSAVGADRSYCSFDLNDYHFIVLDANYNRDGSDYNAGNFNWTETYIPVAEQEWLKNDLEQAQGKKMTIVFVHQNLHDETGDHGVKNAPAVRRILEDAGNVPVVFQGHDHRGGYAEINGIHYVTLRAAVEGSGLKNNAYAMVYVKKNGDIIVKGYGKQGSYSF